MRILFVCFVVVLFISGKLATPVDHVDAIEASGETENSNNDDVKHVETSATEQLNSENDMPDEVIVEPIKRAKKSDYSSAPYPNAPYPSAPYASAPYPSAPYPTSSCAPCGYSQQYAQPIVAYNAPQISYGPASYGGYSVPSPGYGQPQYRPAKYGGRKGKSYIRPQPSYQQQAQPSYQQQAQPSYQQQAQPSYQQQAQPSYQQQAQPSYQQPPQPSYQQPQQSYQQPQPSYQQPQQSYQQPQQSYQQPQPSYQQPQPSYHQSHSAYRPAPAYDPSQSYSYSSSSPSVPCGSNLLFGCQPHVSEVPCSGFSPSNYAPQQHSPPAPAYRNNAEESEVSKSLPTNPTTETTSDNEDKNASKTSTSKDSSVASILSAEAVEKGTNQEHKKDGSPQKDENVSVTNQQGLSPEDQQKNYETMMRMSELAKNFKEPKVSPQQNQLPSSNTQKFNEKSTIPGPQPTSTNVGMNAVASNQVNSQYIPQHPMANQHPNANPWV